ncbi:MAG: DUF1492 domain-containing protein [Selenomonadaceae bacterium]|nr:DUF1492 domain-containing protein [Selenomonadaceae bacterium]
MTKKELNRARDLREQIRDIEWKIIKLRAGAEDLVPILDGLPHGNEVKSRVENLAIKLLAAQEELSRLLEEFGRTALDLEEKINHAELDELEKAVLTLRYVVCMNFLDIQDRLKLNDNSLFYYHRTAVKKILKSIQVVSS